MDKLEPQANVLDPLTLFGLSAALSAAGSTGILERVVKSSCSATECAKELGLTEHLVACVLDVLVASGLIAKRGDRYEVLSLPLLSQLYTPTSLLGLSQQFEATTRVLRAEDPALWLDGTAAQREATYGQWAAGMGEMFADAAKYLAKHLDGQPEHILDIGCGSGVWSLEIAARHPQAKITGLDLPTVLDAFVSRATHNGLQDRITRLPGDMWEIELTPEHYDLVLIANVLRLEPAAKAEQLIARAVAALRPGGRLVIVDALAGGTPRRELARATYALHLGLRTRLGGVHPPSQITEWLRKVGLTDIIEIDCGLQIAAIGALVGKKAG